MVAVCSIKLHLYESFSLKDKRRIVKSVIDKSRSKFNISIAELDYNDSWKSSVLAFSYVSNSRSQADKVVSKVLSFIEMDSRLEIIEQTCEIL